MSKIISGRLEIINYIRNDFLVIKLLDKYQKNSDNLKGKIIHTNLSQVQFT